MNREFFSRKKELAAKGESGFTMLELIAIFAVLGILTAIVVSRVSSTQEYSLASEAETIKGHIRYAHYRAFSDDVPWGIAFGGSSYTLQRDNATAPYSLPNENGATHSLPAGFSVSAATVAFDEWGSPGTANITVTLTGGGGAKIITITKNTGFVP